jgi:hypothetical protein
MMEYYRTTNIASGRAFNVQVEGSYDANHLKKLLKKININLLNNKQLAGSCNWVFRLQPTKKTSEFQLRRILSKIHSAKIVS